MQSIERPIQSARFLEARRAFQQSNVQFPPAVTIQDSVLPWVEVLQREVARGKFDRRTFLKASAAATAGTIIPPLLPEAAAAAETERRQIGDLWLNFDHYPIFNVLRTTNNRHILPKERGFVYWRGFPAGRNNSSFYAEYYYSGQDLDWLHPGFLWGNERVRFTIDAPEEDFSRKGIIRMIYLVPIIGEQSEESVRVEYAETPGYWYTAYTISLDEQGRPEKDANGEVLRYRPLKCMDEPSLGRMPQIQETLEDSTLLFTCDLGFTTPVGIFYGYGDTLYLDEPIQVVRYPTAYFMAEFAQTT